MTRAGKAVLFGLLLVSLGSMVVEITLTRVFSLLLYYHYAFLVISLGMLGLALGGLLVQSRDRLEDAPLLKHLSWGSLAAIATSAATIIIVVTAGFQGVVGFALLAALPFIMVGATTAALLNRFPTSTGRLYAADLVGAAGGAILSVVLLNYFGAVDSLLLAAALMAWGGWSLARSTAGSRLATLSIALMLTLLAAGNPLIGVVQIDIRGIQSGKQLDEELSRAAGVVFSRWDAFARTDVVAPRDNQDLMYVFIDGGAAAAMLRTDSSLSSVGPLRSDVGFFPFHDRPAGDVLDIGPGGGKDVLLALLGGARKVTAVEVNPGTVEAVRALSSFNGGIYDRKDVEVVVDEGRSYLKRSSSRYDTIYLSLAMTQAAERTGYAMTESYLYTTEAIKNYLDHLTPGGQLVFKLHDRYDLERVVRTAMQALEEQGIQADQLSQHFLAISAPGAHGMNDDDVMYPVLVIRKEPYTRAEVSNHISAARASGNLPLYFPWYGGQGPLAWLGEGRRSGDVDSWPFIDLSATSDERPFFYLYSALPPLTSQFPLLLATLVAIRLTRREMRRPPAYLAGWRLSIAYFAALGIAFMLVEVTLIQKLTLFLGHPTLAVTTVLFALLVFAALGSWLSSRTPASVRLSVVTTMLSGILVLAYALILPAITERVFASSPLERVLIATALVAPLGVLVGMPFPSGLRELSRLAATPIGATAWIVNGLASVIGASAAIAIAVPFGFTASLIMGGGTYLLASMFAGLAVRGNVRHPVRDGVSLATDQA